MPCYDVPPSPRCPLSFCPVTSNLRNDRDPRVPEMTRFAFPTPDITSPETGLITQTSHVNMPLRSKRGYREMTSSLTCGVSFESDPVWLWSIRPNSWTAIFLTASDEQTIRLCHSSLYGRIQSKIKVISTAFFGDLQLNCPDVMLISGRKEFLSSFDANRERCVHLFWMSHAPRRCPTSFRGSSWVRLSHCKVGGVTGARGTFGVRAPGLDIVFDPDLRRSLGHILKHSIRPRPCDPDTDTPHYLPTDLLSLSFPRRPVLYPTFMSRTGWGLRPLTDGELSLCFELPPFVEWNDRYLRDLVPIQMFRSILDAVISELDTKVAPLKRLAVPTRAANASSSGSGGDVWIEAVGKWLPGSWSDAVISDKAVKSDNAPIDFKPWHRRIQLVLPCSDHTIAILERFAARAWRRLLCRSFCSYVKSVYGHSWHIGESILKRPAVAEIETNPSKRSRLHDDLSVSTSKRGVIGESSGSTEMI